MIDRSKIEEIFSRFYLFFTHCWIFIKLNISQEIVKKVKQGTAPNPYISERTRGLLFGSIYGSLTAKLFINLVIMAFVNRLTCFDSNDMYRLDKGVVVSGMGLFLIVG